MESSTGAASSDTNNNNNEGNSQQQQSLHLMSTLPIASSRLPDPDTFVPNMDVMERLTREMGYSETAAVKALYWTGNHDMGSGSFMMIPAEGLRFICLSSNRLAL